MGDAEPGVETPWDFAKRLMAEGQSYETIVARLVAEKCVTAEDARILLGAPFGSGSAVSPGAGVSAAASADDGGGGLDGNLLIGIGLIAVGVLLFVATGGRLIAWGVVVVGLGRAMSAFASGRAERRRPHPVALAKDDPSRRCARHPDFASIGTCPRCGSFTCGECSGGQGKMCRACQQEPSTLELRVRTAARWTAAFISGQAVLLIGLGLITWLGKDRPSYLLIGLAMAVPWLILAGIQFFVRNAWPGVVAGLVTIAFLLWMMSRTDDMPELMLLIWLAPLVCSLFAIAAVFERRKVWRLRLAGATPVAAAGGSADAAR